MNRLKSIFVSAYTLLATWVMLHSGLALVQGGTSWAWIGALMAASVPVGFFLRLFLTDVVRTKTRQWAATFVVALGTVVALAGSLAEDRWGVPVIYAVAVLLGWLAYDAWYAKLGRGVNDRLVAGEALPSFPAETPEGESASSDDLRGRPALLLFYRGNWCPLCMAQVKEVATRYQELAVRNARVVLVSPQPPGHTRKLARRFDVPFTFWVDRDLEAAKRLGIVARHGTPAGFQVLGYTSDTVLPTVVLVDEEGTILAVDLPEDYRDRPRLERFTQVLAARG